MFWTSEKKKKRKHLEHAEYIVRYALRMREDLLEKSDLQELQEVRSDLKTRIKTRNFDEIEAVAERAVNLAQHHHPAPKKHYGIRENIEVFAVVISVVMGIRTYVAQPYQIPTGSMQPTLYGITAQSDYTPDWTDKLPVKAIKFLLTGGRYKEVTAKHSGRLVGVNQNSEGFITYQIQSAYGGVLSQYKLHKDFKLRATRGADGHGYVTKGEILASGLQKTGDHVIVNRVAYNFLKPKRGDVVVFSTKGLPYVRPNSSYIKRLVGLPGETIQVCDNKLIVNSEVVTEPENFERQYTDPRYDGYVNGETNGLQTVAQHLRTCEDSLALAEDRYLFMGDNTRNSLDGRWFGGVPGKNIIGPAVIVPWPFVKRGIYGESAGWIN